MHRHALLVTDVIVHEAIDMIEGGPWGNVVTVLAVFEVCLLAESVT